MRVLVTDADTPKALAIARSLGNRHEVWTAASSRLALAAWSRFTRRHLCYEFDSANQLPGWLLNTCRTNAIDVVIPPEEASSQLLSRQQQAFAAHGIQIACLPPEALETAIDKTRTLAAAQRIGIPVPETRTPASCSGILEAAHEIGYPIVVKPRSTRHWNGTRFISTDGVSYATDDAQLSRILSSLDPELPPPILQAFLPGEGIGVCMLIGDGGELLAEFAHRRLRDYRPTGSGSVLRESIAVPAALRRHSLALLRHIGCRGVAMVEFRTDNRRGGVYLMEVNGRFWGSLQLAIDAGVDFPTLLIESMQGRRFPLPVYKEGVILRWWVGDFVRTLRVLKGAPPGFIGTFPSRLSAVSEFIGRQPTGTRSEILRRGDWWPSVIEPLSLMRKFFA